MNLGGRQSRRQPLGSSSPLCRPELVADDHGSDAAKSGGEGMRRWKLGLCVALAIGAVLWGLGISNNHAQLTGQGAASAGLPSFAVLAQKADAEGTIKPVGAPEFAATFTGRKLDTSVWSTCYPWMDLPTGCTDFGNGDEFQWYLASQDVVSNNVLGLTAQRGLTPGFDKQGQPHECIIVGLAPLRPIQASASNTATSRWMTGDPTRFRASGPLSGWPQPTSSGRPR